LHYRDL